VARAARPGRSHILTRVTPSTRRPAAAEAGRRTPRGGVLLVAGALVAGLVALATLSLSRVPAGHLGVTPRRFLDPGWHLVAPFARPRLVPLAGRFADIDVDHTTSQGAVVRLRLAGDYRLDPGRLRTPPGGADVAGALATGGADECARRLVGDLLDSQPEALLGEALAGGPAPAPAPPPLAAAVVGRLGAAGIETSDLALVAGPPAAFSFASGSPAGGNETVVRRDPTGLRLLFIGLDGADWDLADALMRQGRMPRLRRLVEAGVRAPLRSYDPMISPLLWTTMVTGVGPDRHGVADFQAIEAGTGRRVPITSRFRKAPALWEMIGDAGGTSAFVAWWASFPAEPVRGFQVSNLVAFETVRPPAADHVVPAELTWPRDYLDRVRGRLKSAADLRYEEITPLLHVSRAEFEAARHEVLEPRPVPASAGGEGRRAVQSPVALALSIVTGTRNYAAIAADLAARHPDLAAVYFEGIDMMGHRFQHCLPPRLPICTPEDFARFQDAVTGFYVLQDALLGEVVDAAGPGTTVLVVSDHGFRSGTARPPDALPYTTEQPVEWHDPEGIFVLSGPGARKGVRLTARPTLFDIAPTVLHLLGLPSGNDMPGRVVEAALDPAFAGAHPTRRIPTWDRPGRARPAPDASEPGARAAEAELLASLRSLGYIGGDEPAPSPAAHATVAAATGVPQATPPGDGGGAGGGAETTQVFYHRNLATYFLKRQDYTHAADELRLANERQKLPKNYQMLSEALLGLGRRDEARAALVASLDDLPSSDPEPVLWLVELDLQDPGGRERAEATVRKYAARTAARPGLDDALAALLLENAGDAAGALGRYRASFASDPLRLVVAQRLYALESPASRTARLLPALRAAIARDPRLDEYQNLAGVLLAESGRSDEAVAYFRRAADLDPENARFAANLGGALARLDRWPEATEAYGHALDLAPTAATALKLGSALRRTGRLDEALAAFERARALGDDSGGAVLGAALTLAEDGRTTEAIAAAERGLSERPHDESLRRLLDDLRRRRAAPSGGRRPAGTADHPAPGPAR
jgi:tetratricopeptide (TPR) repeat protein